MAEQKLVLLPYYKELTPQQQKGVDGMLAKLKGTEYENGKYETEELLRFLQAREYDVDKAFTMFTNTLKWRQEYKPWEIDNAVREKEAAKGYSVMTPFVTKQGWRVIVTFLAFYDPNNRDIREVERFLIDRVNKLNSEMEPGKDRKILMIVERIGATWKNVDRAYFKQVIPLIASHFPEQLGCGIILRANWLVQIVFNFVKHFVEKRTIDKIRIVGNDPTKMKEILLEFFDEDELWDFWGGKKKFRPDNYDAILSLLGKHDDDVHDKERAEFESSIAKDLSSLENQDQADG